VLYLAYVEGLDASDGLEGPWREVRQLREGLLLVDSDERRSVVYHALKDQRPRGTPILVAALDEQPKLAHMAPGAVAWLRTRG
jgi:hypothetical protein